MYDLCEVAAAAQPWGLEMLSVCPEGAVRVHSLPPRCLFDGHPTFGKEKPKLVGYA